MKHEKASFLIVLTQMISKSPNKQKWFAVRSGDHGGREVFQSRSISLSSPKKIKRIFFTGLELCGGAPYSIKYITDNTAF